METSEAPAGSERGHLVSSDDGRTPGEFEAVIRGVRNFSRILRTGLQTESVAIDESSTRYWAALSEHFGYVDGVGACYGQIDAFVEGQEHTPSGSGRAYVTRVEVGKVVVEVDDFFTGTNPLNDVILRAVAESLPAGADICVPAKTMLAHRIRAVAESSEKKINFYTPTTYVSRDRAAENFSGKPMYVVVRAGALIASDKLNFVLGGSELGMPPVDTTRPDPGRFTRAQIASAQRIAFRTAVGALVLDGYVHPVLTVSGVSGFLAAKAVLQRFRDR